ncbi:YciI family protein [Massilia sp. MB5]|uniref:YciI family protein n=1 Tax=unclassified Massilia TaxID=2609279 RepID=UPI00067BE45F|nr:MULTISPECIES: YciI family protein [unclassified Massilia]AKU21842.1 GTP cyclohydrolase [Massilia sp. NR 4-1]UMR28533.1 YciI family protein [Massilia sp. MB5]
MFVIALTYLKPAAEIDALLGAHREYLREQYANGTFLLSGRMVPRTGGIILAMADSRADIEAVVELDPFKQAGVASYTITEFVPTMAAEALSQFQHQG